VVSGDGYRMPSVGVRLEVGEEKREVEVGDAK
jgi:hypothetical protein